MAGDVARVQECARRLASLLLERYEARFGAAAGRTEAARLEAEYLAAHNPMAPLWGILSDLEAFKAVHPVEWARR